MFDADSAVFGVEAHQADPTVAGNTLFGDLQAFVESHGVQQFFPPAATASRTEDVADRMETEAPKSVPETFDICENNGIMRVPTEAWECSNSRAQRLAACQGIGNGELTKFFFKANQQLMQTHANEPRPNPSAFEQLHAAIEKARALEDERSTEIVQQACQLLENIETKLRGTEDTGVSSQCLDVYKPFQALMDKLITLEWFKYDRKSDGYLVKYDAACRAVDELTHDHTGITKLTQAEHDTFQANAECLSSLQQEYDSMWIQLTRCGMSLWRAKSHGHGHSEHRHFHDHGVRACQFLAAFLRAARHS